MQKIIIISTTLANKVDAKRIAELLLEQKLIACAQISGPITSLYRWKKVTTSATEFSLSIKTTEACADRVRMLLHQEHPYELPEIISHEIDQCSPEYARWVHEEVLQ